MFEDLIEGKVEKDRYRTMLEVMVGYRSFFIDKNVLDFGASFGTSAAALLNLGAKSVIGVEPDLNRVNKGSELLEKAGLSDRIQLIYLENTSVLPFSDEQFEFILANAVIEHIPQPRGAYICEMWRTLAPGGHLIINETPNKYYPREVHTTGLWFNHYLPEKMAHRRAVSAGRFDPDRTDWSSSGWRGLGYYELVHFLKGYELIPETSRFRHKLLTFMGLPASLIDPYPTWVFKKSKDD